MPTLDDLDAQWRQLSEEVISGMKEWRIQHPRATFQEIETALDEGLARLRARMLQDAALLSRAADWHAAERMFEMPAIQNRVDVELGDFATLLGFDLASDRLSLGSAIDLRLYWQARAETAESYKVFVHVLDAEGRVVAQADTFPVGSTRPTTGWLPREVITDQYTIALPGDLPAGQYRLAAGLYDSESSVRLKTNGRSEVIVLTKLEAE